jgi:hypothetical protein
MFFCHNAYIFMNPKSKSCPITSTPIKLCRPPVDLLSSCRDTVICKNMTQTAQCLLIRFYAWCRDCYPTTLLGQFNNPQILPNSRCLNYGASKENKISLSKPLVDVDTWQMSNRIAPELFWNLFIIGLPVVTADSPDNSHFSNRFHGEEKRIRSV